MFDPGINALSILTHIIPGAHVLKEAELSFPRNCETPIAARLLLVGQQGMQTHVEFDFLQEGLQTWDILVETDAGRLRLSMGGKSLTVNDQPVQIPTSTEYADLYAHFADLVHGRRLDVDVTPLQLVADAFLSGRRIEVEAFVE